MENKVYLKSRNFPFVRPSRPPSREYKQSMAMQASPLPNPLKRKLMQKDYVLNGTIESIKRNLKSEKNQTMILWLKVMAMFWR